jgi:endonuclease/exonuclease/phosphatase family metal-dependent hydrolase
MRKTSLIVAVGGLVGCLSSTPPVFDDSSTDTASSSTSTTSTTFETDTNGDGMCNQTPLRVAAFNVQEIGSTSSDQYTGLQDILYRIDADVVCLEEVNDTDINQVAGLAQLAGYEFTQLADKSPPIGGELRNACLSQVPMELIGSYTGSDLSTDPRANDVGRDILAVRVEPTAGCAAVVFSVHLKSGSDRSDTFRRTMEVERLVNAVEAYREQRPDDAVMIAGDFNMESNDGDLNTTFDGVEPGLPDSYQVGSDIQFPIVYQPFARLSDLGFQLVEATWEDSDVIFTWNNASRLDYIWYGQAIVDGAEVYNACQDNGVDDDPPGDWLPKRGEPLACYASTIASDHLPVFADFTLP